MKKVITTGQLTLRKLNAGCGKLMRAIAPTYGAGGKTVLNAGYTGAPELLGKGASAAAAISLADVTENAGLSCCALPVKRRQTSPATAPSPQC